MFKKKPKPSTKNERNKIIEIFEKNDIPFARCFGSKSTYRNNHENELILFNARAYLLRDFENFKNTDISDFFAGQKIECWYGDVNFNEDIYKILKVVLEIREPIVFTTEHGKEIIRVSY